MAVYTDYSFYQQEYGGTKVTEAEFKPLVRKASALAERMTFGRGTDMPEWKTAVCAAVDLLSEENGNLASENNDGYAVTYRTRTERETEEAVCRTIRLFLPEELTNRGCWE